MAATRGEVLTIGDLIYITADQAVLPIAEGDWMIDTAVEPYVLEQWDGVRELNPTHEKVFATTDDDIAFERAKTVISPEETSVTFDPVSGIERIPQSFIFTYFKEEECLIDEVDVEVVDCEVVITIVSYHS